MQDEKGKINYKEKRTGGRKRTLQTKEKREKEIRVERERNITVL